MSAYVSSFVDWVKGRSPTPASNTPVTPIPKRPDPQCMSTPQAAPHVTFPDIANYEDDASESSYDANEDLASPQFHPLPRVSAMPQHFNTPVAPRFDTTTIRPPRERDPQKFSVRAIGETTTDSSRQWLNGTGGMRSKLAYNWPCL